MNIKRAVSLSPEEVQLLLKAACCVMAADGRLADKEMASLLVALNRLCIPHDVKTTRDHIVDTCKRIHTKGVRLYAAKVAEQVASGSDELRASVAALTAELQWADGKATKTEAAVTSELAGMTKTVTSTFSVRVPTTDTAGGTVEEDIQATYTAPAGYYTSVEKSRSISLKSVAAVLLLSILLLVCTCAMAILNSPSASQDGREIAESSPSGGEQIAAPVGIALPRPPADAEVPELENETLAELREQNRLLREQAGVQADSKPQDNEAAAAVRQMSVIEELRQATAEITELKKRVEGERAGSRVVNKTGSRDGQPARGEGETYEEILQTFRVATPKEPARGVSGETRDEFLRKVRVGMTKEQVRDVMGMPKHFEEYKSIPLGRVAYWEQRTTDPRTGFVDQFTNVFIDDEDRVARVVFVVARDKFEAAIPPRGASRLDVLTALGPPDTREKGTWTYEMRTCYVRNRDDPEMQVLGGNWFPIWRVDRSVDVIFTDDERVLDIRYNSW